MDQLGPNSPPRYLPQLATTITQGHIDRILRLVEEGHGLLSAAREAGIHPLSVQAELRANPDFAVLFQLAQECAIEQVEQRCHEMAVNGNFNAMKFFLANKKPQQWHEPTASSKQSHESLSQKITVHLTDAARKIANDPEASLKAIDALPPHDREQTPQNLANQLPND